MELQVRDVARLLNVSERTIYRWIKRGLIPAYRIQDQYRFHRAELLEWATARKVPVAPEIFKEKEVSGAPAVNLVEALRAGGIHYRIGGSDRVSVLREVVAALPLPANVDRDFLLEVLLAREDLGSTAVGDGIAIPHVRNPMILHLERPLAALCFLERPIDFGALDGQPVRTLFAILSPTVRGHLQLLSRLSHALRTPAFRQAVLEQRSREEIVAAAVACEKALEARPGESR